MNEDTEVKTKQTNKISYVKDPLLEPFYVKIDRTCFTCCEECPSETRGTYEREFGFHTSIGAALLSIVQLKLAKDVGCEHTLTDVLKLIKEISLLEKQLKHGK